MDNKRLIKLASWAGKIILESGGETYRVEETITRILIAYGLKDAESFVTPTGIMVSLTEENGNVISLIQRVKKSNVDLEKVSLINSLSRQVAIKHLSLDELNQKLQVIDERKPYSLGFQLFMAALSGFSFTLLFGGNFADASAAWLIGIGVRIMQHYTREINLNGIFINILGGGFVAMSSLFLTEILPFEMHINTIIIGSIMLLVPGIAFTNAIRDTLMGDYLSGVSRGMEAFLIAVGIAIGAGMILGIAGNF
ncbi:MAG: threonine/serine exporter family protein [Clostridiaceae bacterium]